MKEFTGLIELMIWAVFFIGWVLGMSTFAFWRHIKRLWNES